VRDGRRQVRVGGGGGGGLGLKPHYFLPRWESSRQVWPHLKRKGRKHLMLYFTSSSDTGEHIQNSPGSLFKSHRFSFLDILFPGAKRNYLSSQEGTEATTEQFLLIKVNDTREHRREYRKFNGCRKEKQSVQLHAGHRIGLMAKLQ